jgi:hypothetical protein
MIPRGFWEWVLVLLVIVTGVTFLIPPVAITILYMIFGYE